MGAFIAITAPAPYFVPASYLRKARRLLRKGTMKAVIFCPIDMGCQGVQAVLDAGYEVARDFTHADNPAENTFLAPSPGTAAIEVPVLCTG